MPRPGLKRKGTNPPASNRRVANKSTLNSSPRLELEAKLKKKAVGVRPTDSDDSDRLVTTAPSGRNSRSVSKREIFASGGVAAKDIPNSHPSLKSRRPSDAQPSQANQTKQFQNVVNNTLPRLPQSTTSSPVSAQPLKGILTRRKPVLEQSTPCIPTMKPATVAPTPLGGTPTHGISILGTLKPRRREPSILQLVGNGDSSSFNLEDESKFLPDAESTPLSVSSKPAKVSSTPGSSMLPSSISRKRKISPLAATEQASPLQKRHISPTINGIMSIVSGSTKEPELPPMPPAMTQDQKKKPVGDDSEIMAPPKSSSSPAASPQKPKNSVTVKATATRKQTRPTKAISTEALQALMPKRSKLLRRLSHHGTEFEIPIDSDEPDLPPKRGRAAADDEHDDSFVPATRLRKGKAVVKKREAASKTGSRQTRRKRQRATSTLSPKATPLLRPLGNSSTKSSSQQPHLPLPSSRVAKSYGSRHLRDGKDFAASDKENRPESLLPSSSEPVNGAIDDRFSDTVDDLEQVTEKTGPGKETRALKDKFAEIDDWDMEFEEVDVSSSDPMMR